MNMLTEQQENLVAEMNQALNEIEVKEETTGGKMEIREDRHNLKKMAERGHINDINMMADFMERDGFVFEVRP